MEAPFLKISHKSIQPKKWAAALAAVLCALALFACAADPAGGTHPGDDDGLYGSYVFEKQVYMNPLSSFLAFDGYREYYTLTENLLIVTDAAGSRKEIGGRWERAGVDAQAFRKSFMMEEGFGIPDISPYRERAQYTLTDASGADLYRVYRLDGETWLARIHRDPVNAQKNEYIWSIYSIAAFDGEIPLQTALSGT